MRTLSMDPSVSVLTGDTAQTNLVPRAQSQGKAPWGRGWAQTS